LLAGCGGSSDSSSSSGSAKSGGKTALSLVAYSTPQAAYDALIPKFQGTAAGRGVTFNESFGASGEQSRAVDAGLPADVVAFSLATDVTRLVKDGLVSSGWDSDPFHGFVTDSVVTLVVRKGNPKHIAGWDDLVKPGVQVITPNPFTSGSARWNLLAAYGAQLELGRSKAQAQAYLQNLLTKHVVVQDKSGRDALQTFAAGKGDVLISYENEAIGAQQKGIKVDYVIPKQTILIENPIAVVSKSKHLGAAEAFVSWVRTAPAQRVFAEKGYRPVLQSVFKEFAARFPQPAQLFKIGFLGGWKKVTSEFFDPTNGLVTKIEQHAGVSTASG
jgi:sulfate transport system substrate-binding protein